LDFKNENHEALLAALERDNAQWAYFTTVPTVWADETTAMMHAAMTKYWPHGGTPIPYTNNKEEFWRLAHRLFLKADVGEQLSMI
jgi:hypothetical protein